MIELNDVYLEIADRCFSSCVMCDTKSQDNKKLMPNNANHILSLLKTLGCKKVRFTGKEPMANEALPGYLMMCRNKGMSTDVLTTLLGPEHMIPHLAHSDIIRVSLSSIGKDYHRYFGVHKWALFMRNFASLMEERSKVHDKKIIINYTIFSGNANFAAIDAFVSFINTMQKLHDVKFIVHFFPAMEITNSRNYDPALVHEMYEDVLHSAEFEYALTKDNFSVSMHSCDMGLTHWYITTDGDIYPCCMSGGELGQRRHKELLLGNVYTDSIEELSKEDNKRLKNLCNSTCSNCTPKYFKRMPTSFQTKVSCRTKR